MPGARDAPSPVDHEPLMRLALAQAKKAMHMGEVPVGAVLAEGARVVAEGFNQPIHGQDPTAHAEVVALRGGARALGNYRMPGTTLYVTVEPCLMCVGALVNARVMTLVYGVDEPKWGAVRSLLDVRALALNHRLRVVRGVLEEDCRRLLVDFFRFRRQEG